MVVAAAFFLTVCYNAIFESRDSEARYILVPQLANRLQTPWRIPPRIEAPSLRTSRHRVLYSALRERGDEHLGRTMQTIAADIGTSLRLGLTYSHRSVTLGSLSRGDPDAVEALFNWGRGHLARNFLRDDACTMSGVGARNASNCPVCQSLRAGNKLSFRHLVTLPYSLTYGWNAVDEAGRRGRAKIANFTRRALHTQSHTVFQMPLANCGDVALPQFIAPRVRAYFFHRYWDAHASAAHAGRFGITEAMHGGARGGGGQSNAMAFSESELNIAIHARRGDFFDKNKAMVSAVFFGKVLRNFMRIVQAQGGVFANMPVAVYFFSEGVLKHGIERSNTGYDMTERTTSFQDSDGAVLPEAMVRALLDDADVFQKGFRLVMRISSDTVQAVREMAAADVFFGSESRLSTTVVQSITRAGVVFIPTARTDFVAQNQKTRRPPGGLRVFFNRETGDILEEDEARRLWRHFTRYNRKSAARVMATSDDHSIGEGERAAVTPKAVSSIAESHLAADSSYQQ